MSPPPSPSRTVVTSRSTSLRRRPFPLTLSSIKEHPDPADLDAEDEAAAYQLKIIPEPDCRRQSRLPREKLVETRDIDNSRFGVSLVLCRTSCCRTLVRVEQISDWLHDRGAPVEGCCPSCKTYCFFESIPSLRPGPNLLQKPQSSPNLALLRRAILQRLKKDSLFSSPPPPVSLPIRRLYSAVPPKSGSPLLRVILDSTYKLFDADNEEYPDTEHALVLGSSEFSTEMYEVSVRVTSIACLTLLLYALFT
jgi:hypothetical protein